MCRPYLYKWKGTTLGPLGAALLRGILCKVDLPKAIEFQNHFVIHFAQSLFHPNQFPVEMGILLCVATRTHDGKITRPACSYLPECIWGGRGALRYMPTPRHASSPPHSIHTMFQRARYGPGDTVVGSEHPLPTAVGHVHGVTACCNVLHCHVCTCTPLCRWAGPCPVSSTCTTRPMMTINRRQTTTCSSTRAPSPAALMTPFTTAARCVRCDGVFNRRCLKS